MVIYVWSWVVCRDARCSCCWSKNKPKAHKSNTQRRLQFDIKGGQIAGARVRSFAALTDAAVERKGTLPTGGRESCAATEEREAALSRRAENRRRQKGRRRGRRVESSRRRIIAGAKRDDGGGTSEEGSIREKGPQKREAGRIFPEVDNRRRQKG
jgi:hypothetical protein